MPHHYNHTMVYLDTRKLLSAYFNSSESSIQRRTVHTISLAAGHTPFMLHVLVYGCTNVHVVKVPNLVVGMVKAVWSWVH